ncbi:MAG: cadherin-like beta sandwich domain-containing protein [Chitinivibrionales bacterium]
MASIHSGKIAVVSSSCLIVCLGVLFSCVKDTPFVANNPLDEQGANWHPPVVNASTRDTSVSILDTVTFRAHGTDTADPRDVITRYFWSVNALAPSTAGADTFKYSFGTSGTDTMYVRCLNKDSVSSTYDTIVVNVHSYVPSLRFDSIPSTNVAQGKSATFYARASDTMSSQFQFIWTDTSGVFSDTGARTTARDTTARDSRSYVFRGNRMYIVAVKVIDRHGQVSGADSLRVVANGNAPVITAPVQGDTLAFNQVTINWVQGTYNTRQRLTLTGDPDFTTILFDTSFSGSGVNGYHLVQIDYGRSYRVTVYGYNGLNDSAVSRPIGFSVMPEPFGANARLKSLGLMQGSIQVQLSPSFNKNTLVYRDTVDSSVSSMTVTAVPDTSQAIVTFNGMPNYIPGQATTTVPQLSLGLDTVFVLITATDKVTQRTYQIITFRRGASDAYLQSLQISPGALVPLFNRDSLTYRDTVLLGTASVQISPSAEDGYAGVKINGAAYSYVLMTPLVDSSGVDTVKVAVTAENHLTTKTYRVIVFRIPDRSDSLMSLASNSVLGLSPTFSSSTFNYRDTASYFDSLYKLTAYSMDQYIRIAINGKSALQNLTVDSIKLNPGMNTVTVRTTAQDTSKHLVYTVSVYRYPPDTNAALASLYSSHGLTPSFTTNTFNYYDTVPYLDSLYSLTPTASATGVIAGNSSMKITVNGIAVASGYSIDTIRLAPRSNTVTVRTTAQDTSKHKVYTVSVYRIPPDTNAALYSLSAQYPSYLKPSFSGDMLNYSDTVVYSDSLFQLLATAINSYINITINGRTAPYQLTDTVKLSQGINAITVRTTAQDTGVHRNYVVKVVRLAPSRNAQLDSIGLSAGGLVPKFDTTVTLYSVQVPHEITSIQLTPGLADTTATVKINGTAVASGKPSGPVTLNAGTTSVIIAVVAQDASVKKSDTIVVQRGDSATVIPGLMVSGADTIKKTGSPYHVTGGILVQAGGNLVIQAGVTLLMDPQVSIDVKGKLAAIGASSDSIVFRAYNASAGQWGYVNFSATAVPTTLNGGVYQSGSVLQYCVFENGGNTSTTNAVVNTAGIYLLIANCSVRLSAIRGIYSQDSCIIDHCRISNCATDGIRVDNNCVIRYCMVSGCQTGINANWYYHTLSYDTVENCGGTGILMNNSSKALYCLASGNQGGGFSCGGTCTVYGCQAIGNSVPANNTSGVGGIYIASGLVCQCLISGNQSGGTPALYMGGGTTADSNTISGNQYTGSNATGAGYVTIYGPDTLTYNNIVNNTGASYLVSNGSAYGYPNVNAQNNFWGAGSSTNSIRPQIYDYFKNSNLSVVDIGDPQLSGQVPNTPPIQ